MRKLLLIVLSFCFLLGMATKAEVENVKEEAEKGGVKSETNPESGINEPLIKLSEEPALYRTEISQVTPQSGIITGHVIAYGHYIKPPYKLQIENDTILFINEIQIIPRFMSKFEIEKKERQKIRREEKYREAEKIAKPYRERLHSLFDKMGNIYKFIEPKMGRNKAIDSVFKLARAETLIVKMDTNFVGNDDCVFVVDYFQPGYDKLPDDLSSIRLMFHGGDPASGFSDFRKTLDPDEKKKFVNYWKDRAEEILRDGDAIFNNSFNKTGVHYCSDYQFWRVLNILGDKDLSIEEKIGKLNSVVILSYEESAKELIYNFNPDEWPEKEDIKK